MRGSRTDIGSVEPNGLIDSQQANLIAATTRVSENVSQSPWGAAVVLISQPLNKEI